MKILVDEMHEGLVKDLRNEGYDVESVKELINKKRKMTSDFSVLAYAKKNDMVLISADVENQKGCEENGIKYVPINNEIILKVVLDGLKKFDFSNQITDEAILERSFSFCNEAMHTISLQVRRLQAPESEDSKFLHRKWADLRFLILSLDRLYKAAGVASNIKRISSEIENARDKFQRSVQFKNLRDVGEHFDSYSMDKGWLKDISRKDLQVGEWSSDGTYFRWLGEEINIIEWEKAAIELFKTIRDIKNNFFKKY